MEKNNKVITAVVSLAALVVGIFIGITMQGNGLMQGKLSLLNTKGAKQCENYKSLYYQGQLTQALGYKKAEDAVNKCQKNYKAYWNAFPTTSECSLLAEINDKFGTAAFSNFLKKKKIANSNAIYCSQNHPFMWFDQTNSQILSETECWKYENFINNGGDLMKLFKQNAKTVNIVTDKCTQSVVGWAPAINFDEETCHQYKVYLDEGVLSGMITNGGANAQIAFSCQAQYPNLWYKMGGVNLSQYICLDYKKYFDKGTLTDMVNAGKLDGNVAPQCSIFYQYIWNGVTHAECDEFGNWYKKGVLTPNMGGNTNKAVEAVEACKYYGYGDLFW